MNNFQMVSAMSMSWSSMTVGFWLMRRLLHDTLLESEEMAQVANAGLLTVIVVVLVILLDKFADLVQYWQRSSADDPTQATRRNSTLEIIIRTLIDAFGLLVGLCWEKATDAAMETIIEGNHWFAEHHVLSKLFFAALMMLFMFTAWIKYIVPSAKKLPADHEVDLLLEGNANKAAFPCCAHEKEMSAEDAAKVVDVMIEKMKPLLDNEVVKTQMVRKLNEYITNEKLSQTGEGTSRSEMQPLVGSQ